MRFNRDFFERYTFFLLLASLLMSYTLTPFLEEKGVTSKAFQVILMLSIFCSIIIVSSSKLVFLIVFPLSLPMLLWVFGFSFVDSEKTSIAVILATVSFFIYIAVMLLKKVLIAKKIDENMLCGALSVYFIIGIIWGFLYSLVDITIIDSYNFSTSKSASNDINDFMYFSLVTLTTLGYGDVTPLSSAARSLTVTEALVGQLYMAVVMAKLIGVYIQTPKD